jgi:sulfur relay (sulfurtransferase) complex TusBCD TusD component (DsrE family)
MQVGLYDVRRDFWDIAFNSLEEYSYIIVFGNVGVCSQCSTARGCIRIKEAERFGVKFASLSTGSSGVVFLFRFSI